MPEHRRDQAGRSAPSAPRGSGSSSAATAGFALRCSPSLPRASPCRRRLRDACGARSWRTSAPKRGPSLEQLLEQLLGRQGELLPDGDLVEAAAAVEATRASLGPEARAEYERLRGKLGLAERGELADRDAAVTAELEAARPPDRHIEPAAAEVMAGAVLRAREPRARAGLELHRENYTLRQQLEEQSRQLQQLLGKAEPTPEVPPKTE